MAAEQAEFEELWARHHRRVHAYALRRTDAATAQDVVAETFLVAWRRRAELPDEPLPWLLGVARHVLANDARGRRRRDALARVLADNTHAYGAARPAVDEDLLRALGELGPNDREALVLTAWDGLTPAEAAAVVGTTGAAFRVRLLRARRRLEAALAAGGQGRSVSPHTVQEPT